ncbi:hypothetical protein GCM10009863_21810 [Streptomyces axinellae]|uniref:ER-bound oxygenase mpaB/mpaB'/Rubber oxygenase catalytic domain-containing protein n=2 Tax=Streptomyces axinellae TaxID=552788 RepID=A0ABN3Q1V5_9ACTN
MEYVLACFTVCPLRFIDAHGHRPVTDDERATAYAFHRDLAAALGLPPSPAGGLAEVARRMDTCETRHFAPTEAARALWRSTSAGLPAARLPAPLAPLASAVTATLLDEPLRTALGVRRPPAPVRALATYAPGSRRRGPRTGRRDRPGGR